LFLNGAIFALARIKREGIKPDPTFDRATDQAGTEFIPARQKRDYMGIRYEKSVNLGCSLSQPGMHSDSRCERVERLDLSLY